MMLQTECSYGAINQMAKQTEQILDKQPHTIFKLKQKKLPERTVLIFFQEKN